MGNDLWRTPQWLFAYLNESYGPFDIDLAANADNTKCAAYLDAIVNSLSQPWSSRYKNGFCNPPYSDLNPWLIKAHAENYKGFKSTWVLPTWNGEKFWRNTVFEYGAKSISRIFGRVGFLDEHGNAVNGNRAGTMIIHYNGLMNPKPQLINLDRDELIEIYESSL